MSPSRESAMVDWTGRTAKPENWAGCGRARVGLVALMLSEQLPRPLMSMSMSWLWLLYALQILPWHEWSECAHDRIESICASSWFHRTARRLERRFVVVVIDGRCGRCHRDRGARAKCDQAVAVGGGIFRSRRVAYASCECFEIDFSLSLESGLFC